MDIELWVIIVMCLAYFSAGFVDSIAGGGGLISIPAFLLTGVPVEFALGTNKLVAPMGTISSLVIYTKNGAVIWKMAFFGIPAALTGGFLGTETILLFDSSVITKFILFLFPVGVLITLLPKKEREEKELTSKSVYLYGTLICFILGFYDGFFGAGTGSFFIIFFSFFLGMGLIRASATSKIFNLTTGIGSLASFVINGKILYMLAIPLIISNILGNIIGSKLAIKVGASFIKKVLFFSIALLFTTLLFKVMFL